MKEHGCFVGGSWVIPGDPQFTENINPSDHSDVIGRYLRGTADLVDDAVTAAREAYPGWSKTSPLTRSNLLEAVSAQIRLESEDLAGILAREEGKTLEEARGEVARASQLFHFFGGEALRMTGEHQQSTREGVSVAIRRESIGVVGIITPWNFPIAIASWKMAPALAFGNTIVLKPADLVPATAHALFSILERVGFPPGVVNLVTGPGSVVGESIITHPGIDALTFTGSEGVGRHVAASGAANLVRVQLEMGGKNPLLVMADADLDVAVDVALNGAFFQTGQRCTASSRLLVDDAVHDEFVERLVAGMRSLTVGHALDSGTLMGPVVDEKQLASDVEYIELARATPGSTVYGGDRVTLEHDGNYLSPALIVGLDNDARVNREEVFGPVAGVIRVSGYDEGLAIANDTVYGLSAGICTTSLRYAEHFQANAEAGMVMVNLPTAGVDPHVPFGGRKGSSYGPREQGAYARHFFTQTKTSYIQP